MFTNSSRSDGVRRDAIHRVRFSAVLAGKGKPSWRDRMLLGQPTRARRALKRTRSSTSLRWCHASRFFQQAMMFFELLSTGFFAQHQHLGGDTQSDFVGSFCAEIEPDGSMDLGQAFVGDALFQKVFEDMLNLTWATNHADISGIGLQSCSQRILIERVAARHNHNPARLVRL